MARQTQPSGNPTQEQLLRAMGLGLGTGGAQTNVQQLPWNPAAHNAQIQAQIQERERLAAADPRNVIGRQLTGTNPQIIQGNWFRQDAQGQILHGGPAAIDGRQVTRPPAMWGAVGDATALAGILGRTAGPGGTPVATGTGGPAGIGVAAAAGAAGGAAATRQQTQEMMRMAGIQPDLTGMGQGHLYDLMATQTDIEAQRQGAREVTENYRRALGTKEQAVTGVQDTVEGMQERNQRAADAIEAMTAQIMQRPGVDTTRAEAYLAEGTERVAQNRAAVLAAGREYIEAIGVRNEEVEQKLKTWIGDSLGMIDRARAETLSKVEDTTAQMRQYQAAGILAGLQNEKRSIQGAAAAGGLGGDPATMAELRHAERQAMIRLGGVQAGLTADYQNKVVSVMENWSQRVGQFVDTATGALVRNWETGTQNVSFAHKRYTELAEFAAEMDRVWDMQKVQTAMNIEQLKLADRQMRVGEAGIALRGEELRQQGEGLGLQGAQLTLTAAGQLADFIAGQPVFAISNAPLFAVLSSIHSELAAQRSGVIMMGPPRRANRAANRAAGQRTDTGGVQQGAGRAQAPALTIREQQAQIQQQFAERAAQRQQNVDRLNAQRQEQQRQQQENVRRFQEWQQQQQQGGQRRLLGGPIV